MREAVRFYDRLTEYFTSWDFWVSYTWLILNRAMNLWSYLFHEHKLSAPLLHKNLQVTM